MTDFEISELRTLLIKAMNSLDERERIVLKKIFFGNQTIKSISEEHKCTRDRITKIRDKALLKLSRKALLRELK